MNFSETFNIAEAHAHEHAFIANSQVAMALETEGIRLNPETVKLGVGAVLLDPTKGKYFVVKDAKGEAIACTLTIPEWSDWRNGTVLWIHSLYVIPSMRGKGVYRALYSYLQDLVNENPHLMGLRLYVDHKNQTAKSVYQKLGMNNDHYALFEWMKG